VPGFATTLIAHQRVRTATDVRTRRRGLARDDPAVVRSSASPVPMSCAAAGRALAISGTSMKCSSR